MNILHIVAGDLDKGAARGAYWLHQGILSQGASSTILNNGNFDLGDDTVVLVCNEKSSKLIQLLKRNIEKLLMKFYPKRDKRIFSTGLFGYNFTKTDAYKQADIIHLHWINGCFVNVKHLKNINKPIVWTLRDLWPITGGCHCPINGCERYTEGCGYCTQLLSKRKNDLSRYILKRKLAYLPSDAAIIGQSHWLSQEAKRSYLFRNSNVQTISNCIDTKLFFPLAKGICKDLLGIKTDKKLILVGAQNLDDTWKGFKEFLEAISFLRKDSYFIVFFGNIDSRLINDLGFEYKNLGFLHDSVSLRIAYSCADVFVAPSLFEAFGKTLVESMSCATPVVCFDATGPSDIVDHKQNGYKAQAYDPNDLAKGIEWVSKCKSYDQLAHEARVKATSSYDKDVIAKQYIDLYNSL